MNFTQTINNAGNVINNGITVPRKVYLVITSEPDSIIIGIFSTYEKAKDAKDNYMYNVHIQEFEMDKAIG